MANRKNRPEMLAVALATTLILWKRCCFHFASPLYPNKAGWRSSAHELWLKVDTKSPGQLCLRPEHIWNFNRFDVYFVWFVSSKLDRLPPPCLARSQSRLALHLGQLGMTSWMSCEDSSAKSDLSFHSPVLRQKQRLSVKPISACLSFPTSTNTLGRVSFVSLPVLCNKSLCPRHTGQTGGVRRAPPPGDLPCANSGKLFRMLYKDQEQRSRPVQKHSLWALGSL